MADPFRLSFERKFQEIRAMGFVTNMETITGNIPAIRFAFLASAFLGYLGLTCNTAHAEKALAKVTPESLRAHGFSLRVDDQKNGTVAFTLSRDLSKTKAFPADSDLRVRRHATLEVFGKSGLLAVCQVAPDARHQEGTITYRFTLARDCVAHSSLTLAEDDDYKDQTREHLIGSGTHYQFNLALFAGHQSAGNAHSR